jgi:hypothetical protein
MAKTELLAIASPGSRALTNAKYERYCRLRASLQPRAQAYREAGWETSDDENAYSNACRLERRPGVRERIEYLSHQDEELIAEKRRRIEGQLWAIHEADIGAFWETYEAAKTGKDGKLATDQEGKILTVRKQRAKLINDLPPESRKLIEDVFIDRNGNVIPRLYSKAQANAELRKLLGIGSQEQPKTDDVSRLSDAELIAQLSDTAKELGIKIDLNYSFAQQLYDAEPDVVESDVAETAAPEMGVIEADVAAPDASAPPGQPEAEKPDRNRREDAKARAAAALRYGQIAPWGDRPKVRR